MDVDEAMQMIQENNIMMKSPKFYKDMRQALVDLPPDVCIHTRGFGQSVNEQVVDLQNRYFPRPAKMLMFVLKITYSIVILVLLIGQLVNLSFQDTCDAIFDHTSVWSGCAIKIPFCKQLTRTRNYLF